MVERLYIVRPLVPKSFAFLVFLMKGWFGATIHRNNVAQPNRPSLSRTVTSTRFHSSASCGTEGLEQIGSQKADIFTGILLHPIEGIDLALLPVDQDRNTALVKFWRNIVSARFKFI